MKESSIPVFIEAGNAQHPVLFLVPDESEAVGGLTLSGTTAGGETVIVCGLTLLSLSLLGLSVVVVLCSVLSLQIVGLLAVVASLSVSLQLVARLSAVSHSVMDHCNITTDDRVVAMTAAH